MPKNAHDFNNLWESLKKEMRILDKVIPSVVVEGTVEHGFSRGSKTLGHATANLNSSTSDSLAKFLESSGCRDGIYIGWAVLPGICAPFQTAISVGINPTYEFSHCLHFS